VVLEVEYADSVAGFQWNQAHTGIGDEYMGLAIVGGKTDNGLVDLFRELPRINTLEVNDLSVGGGAGENEPGCGDRCSNRDEKQQRAHSVQNADEEIRDQTSDHGGGSVAHFRVKTPSRRLGFVVSH